MNAKTRPDRLTLFVILDGFRHDFLERAAYLSSIADWRGKVREPFGFIATRPAMFAGLTPEQTDICFEYRFGPDGRTFRPWLCNTLAGLGRVVPSAWLRMGATAWLRLVGPGPVVRRTAWVGHMPFERLPLFDFAEHVLPTDPDYVAQPTVFDLLRERGERFLYHGFARRKHGLETLKRVYHMMIRRDLFEADTTATERFTRELAADRPDFAHLHLSVCDWVGHRYGPDSDEMAAAIRFVDERVRQVHECAAGLYRDVRLLVCADHGMVRVEHTHDLAAALGSVPFREPHDFVAFRDSTMARFWFFKPDAYHAVHHALSGLPWGRVLDADERRRLHIRFPDNRNGDLFFLLDPGHVWLPNYYQAAGAPPRGMHGFEPDAPDNLGAALLHNPPRPVSVPAGATLDLVDVFPTLLDLHGLDHPDGLPGRSAFGP